MQAATAEQMGGVRMSTSVRGSWKRILSVRSINAGSDARGEQYRGSRFLSMLTKKLAISHSGSKRARPGLRDRADLRSRRLAGIESPAPFDAGAAVGDEGALEARADRL